MPCFVNFAEPKDPTADTFTEKMVAQVIKNLQVTIKNIHVRFEDKYTNRHRPFVAGVTLEGLNFQVSLLFINLYFITVLLFRQLMKIGKQPF